jgi:hypothetical protein
VDSFCAYSGCSGEYPVAGLVQATNGEFYGTTSYGGATGTGGTVTILWAFFTVFVGLLNGLTAFRNEYLPPQARL